MSNHVRVDQAAIEELTSRSVAAIYPSKDALVEQLKSGKQLSFYVGIDPTADYVHLGHSTNYFLLERLHNLGHRIIVLVGDFTAMIGDPSDKNSARVQLTVDQVKDNLKTFKAQIGKILDFESKDNPIEFQFNSKWLASLTFLDAVDLAANFTVQQMLERDAFEKRLKENKPLFVHEFFYPLMQGYDSVAMDVDAEIGGTDQTFNMLAGRVLQRRYHDKEKFVIATTLLENPETGEKLMSKSLGTGVALNEEPFMMFVKVMQLPDAGVLQCFVDCTRLPMSEIDQIRQQWQAGTVNPRDIKLRLAHEIVTIYHGQSVADDMQQAWLKEVSQKETASNIADLKVADSMSLIDAVVASSVVASKSEARRLLSEGALKLNGQKVSAEDANMEDGDLLQIGKRHTFRLKKAN